MRVVVVRVGEMGMVVGERRVLVRVTVRLGEGAGVRVLVVRVVDVAVLVDECLMGMGVPVALGE